MKYDKPNLRERAGNHLTTISLILNDTIQGHPIKPQLGEVALKSLYIIEEWLSESKQKAYIRLVWEEALKKIKKMEEICKLIMDGKQIPRNLVETSLKDLEEIIYWLNRHQYKKKL